MATRAAAMSGGSKVNQKDLKKFKKIDDALARIEGGTFGICEICEEEISVKRLEARPVTTMCIRCKEEQEKQEKSYG